ncbi:sensor histidine kinase, partial [Bacillus sp. D-CC]
IFLLIERLCYLHQSSLLLEGKSYVSKATGSLGPSLRGKVPIRNQENEIIGVVSVGFSMDDIHGAVEVYGKRV